MRIDARLARLRGGNPGDVKAVGGGVSELRIDYGPGYRVYTAMADNALVVLLCGGDKRTQAADIKQAKKFWAYTNKAPVNARTKIMKTEPTVSYKADLLERLRDPEYATGYLNAVLEENDEAAFQVALRDVAEAGQMQLTAMPLQWAETTKLLRGLGLQVRLDLVQAA